MTHSVRIATVYALAQDAISEGGNRANAEPLLLKGYEGMKVRLDKTPGADATLLAMMQRLPEAAQRLVAVYTAVEQPDEAKKWKLEWAKYACKTLPLPRDTK